MVIDKMRARLADAHADHGTPCRWCASSALSCQIAYLESNEQDHCCRSCHEVGAAVGHADSRLSTHQQLGGSPQ